ncbi:recombinase family protein [Sphaerisporangium sp. NPDC005288]|uniref:recombinase family protein n=1 Tax=Sphaerisporangium sp. NPDC005288 TaxID=3155114 RepID=UPI0033A31C0A
MRRLPALTSEDFVPVVSYARASSDKRNRDEHSVKDQHKINGRTAAEHGWTVVREYTDNDKSAAKPDVVRDDFELMLKALKAGALPDGSPVRGVVVTHDDRLVRRPGDYERFVDAFTYNDGFVFADAKQTKNLYSEDVESMGLFGAVISKMEVRKMQRRMRSDHRRRAEAGIAVGGHRPFGWMPDRRTLDPVEAPLLRQAARDFLAGRSLKSIVDAWLRQGVQTPRGNPWRGTRLRETLANARLCGWRELHGELVLDESGEPVVGDWAPIITPDEWRAVRSIIDSRRGRSVNGNGTLGAPLPPDFREHKYLLTGIVRCGHPKAEGGICNTPLRVAHTYHKGNHVYKCLSKSEGGCGSLSRNGDLVDFFISQLVLSKMEKEATFTNHRNETSWLREEEYQQAKERLYEFTRQWEAGNVDNDHYFKTLSRLQGTVNQLRAERSNFNASAERSRQRAAIDTADIRKRWHLAEEDGGLPLSQKRAHIREALHAVIVLPAGKGNKPFNPDLLDPIWRED